MEITRPSREYWQVLEHDVPIAFIYTASSQYDTIAWIGLGRGISPEHRLSIFQLSLSYVMRFGVTYERAYEDEYLRKYLPPNEFVTNDSAALMNFDTILPYVRRFTLEHVMQFLHWFHVTVVEECDFDSIDTILARVLSTASLSEEVSFQFQIESFHQAVGVQFTTWRMPFTLHWPNSSGDGKQILFHLSLSGKTKPDVYYPVITLRPTECNVWLPTGNMREEMESVLMILSIPRLRSAQSQNNLAYLLSTLLGRTGHFVKFVPPTAL